VAPPWDPDPPGKGSDPTRFSEIKLWFVYLCLLSNLLGFFSCIENLISGCGIHPCHVVESIPRSAWVLWCFAFDLPSVFLTYAFEVSLTSFSACYFSCVNRVLDLSSKLCKWKEKKWWVQREWWMGLLLPLLCCIHVKNSRLNYRIPCMAVIFGSKHVLLEVASGEAVVGKKFLFCAPCHTLLVDGAGYSFSSVAPMGRPHPD